MTPTRIDLNLFENTRCGPVSVRGVGGAAAHQERLRPSPLLGGPA